MISKKKKEYVIRVHFYELVNGKQDYYFGSLKAIYTQFTPQQIGCRLHRLYGIKPLASKETQRCRISKEVVLRMEQRNKPEK